ncbi:MAG: LLM class flavin-dependent oxidoreductase [Proteobacteria bacterium]|nr:LLM class flavin-dependent oxidoreductase [Pseudomonadota bacterium]
MMELGLFVEPQMGGSYRRLAKLARWAEGFGLDAFARSDHYLHMDHSADASDALVTLGGLALETEAIRLATLVSPITFRHPAIMAKAATTIDEMSNGRFTLGVGTGWMESEHDAFGLDLPPLKERFTRLEEALVYIRTVFSGGGDMTGEYYTLNQETIAPQASPGLEIVVGGGGSKKTPRLAGTYADEYNMFVTDRESLEQRLSVMRDAATSAGRNPDDILISFAGPSFVYDSEADHEAALVERGAKRDMSPDEYAAFLDARSVPHGTPERAASAIAQMGSWGVGRFYVQDISPLDDIDIPHLETIFSALKI